MYGNVPILIDLWIRDIPNIAMTTSSLSISKDPRAMKYIDVRMSPGCMRVSPGGACVDLNCIDKARRHPEMEEYMHLVIHCLHLHSQSILCGYAGQPNSSFEMWFFRVLTNSESSDRTSDWSNIIERQLARL